MDAKKQYNKNGKKYILAQEKLFAKKLDPANDFIMKVLPKKTEGLMVLDFGCGHGKTINLLRKKKFRAVFGIDCSKAMIAEAQKNLQSGKNLFVANIEKTPFKNNFFDVVISRFALHYLKNFDKAYTEINRILKKGGSFVFVIDHPFRDLSWSKSQKYGQQEIIDIKLYAGKITITFPTHTLSDYFSKIFQKYFYMDAVLEGHSPEAHMDKFHSPDYLAIKAVKR